MRRNSAHEFYLQQDDPTFGNHVIALRNWFASQAAST